MPIRIAMLIFSFASFVEAENLTDLSSGKQLFPGGWKIPYKDLDPLFDIYI